MTYSYKYQKNQMSDSEIYQKVTEIEELKDCDCHFCRSAEIEPPAEGNYGEGMYYDGFDHAIKFRGIICDMHKDELEWIEFRWIDTVQ